LFHGSICFGSSRLVRAPCSVFGLPVHKSKGAADFRSQFSVRASVAVLPCRLVLRFSVRSSAVKFWFDLFVSSAKVRFSSCAQDSLAFSWLPPIVRVAAALADTRVRVVNRTCVHNADAILLSSDFSHRLLTSSGPDSEFTQAVALVPRWARTEALGVIEGFVRLFKIFHFMWISVWIVARTHSDHVLEPPDHRPRSFLI
jgi:hypothetical protein